MITESTAPLLAALLAGLTYGTLYCGPSCGPFLCAFIMGTNTGSFQAARSLAVFTAARVTTYGIVGVVSGLLGTDVFSTHTSGSPVLGVVVIMIGGWMWRRTPQRQEPDGLVQIGKSSTARGAQCMRSAGARPLWLAGTAFALTPCPPMLAMLACAAHTGSPWTGAAIMMLFGLGTSLSPLILICLMAGHFSQRLRSCAPEQAVLFRRTASLTLVALGSSMVFHGG